MQIKKINKKKNNLYEIILSDNTSLSFYDDTIIKYNLLTKKEIDKKKLDEINSFNQKIEAYYKAIKYINKKLRTKKEISKYLKEYNKSIVNETIERLENEKYINDEVYIRSYVNDQINLSLKGPKKITLELLKLGFNEIGISNYLNTFDSDLWCERIKKIINKKINANHKLSNKLLIQKIKEYLVNLGYDIELINVELDKIDLNSDNDKLENEYLKTKKKLEKKYSGEELNKRIKNSLILKGFSSELIDEIINN